MAHRRTRLLVAALASATVTACGSTVPLATQQQAPGGGLSDLGGTPVAEAPSGSSALGEGAAPGTVGTSGGAVVGPGTSTSTIGGAGPVGTTGPTSGGTTGARDAASYGQGITATTVKVGFGYDPNQDATNSTIAQGLAAGNARQMTEAYAAKLNAAGGIGGRKIVLDPYAVNTQAANYQAELDGMCKHFTTDAKDFASLTGGDAALNACLEKGGLLTVETNLTVTSEADFAAAPHYFEPATMAMERRARNLPQALADQGWFGDSAKVGVLSYDTPGFRRAVEKELLPRLQGVGHPVDPADVQLVAYPTSYGEYGGLASAISSAVLRFRQDDVTHIVVLDAKGVATLFLMTTADSQAYYPKYGIDSAAGVQTLYEGGNVQRSQVANATGIGWLPRLDVPSDRVPKNPAADACLAFFTSKGFAAGNNNARAVQLGICDTFQALEVALGGGARNRDAAARALEAARVLRPLTALGTGFTPTRHDGVSTYRFLRWDEECGCMSYVGSDRTAL